MKRFIFILATNLAMGAAGCQEKVPEPEPPPKPSKPAAGEPNLPEQTDQKAGSEGSETKKGDVVIEDSKVGTGPAAKNGDTLVVHYTGKLEDGTKFDSSLDRDDPFELKLGAGGVIKGWEEGLVGMKKGGKRKLTIPPEKGYGKRGSPPKIPPNATLVFDVELLKIK